ncbi:Peptidase C13, legumain [Metarhizium album ARSEF 1941]|uniref:Peptidase C13, legumain n=1 Tax=Metarhizium album (strain ARSEF 1941) TaxID=1081103 RepID=A0A0B2WI62_METAS|nr:Peptidase C13, legumain [Metarhizium album ARSEF 1941]KHN95711.1 Peptidase C13, legumain [Metarhizium album ARSEF 1941]
MAVAVVVAVAMLATTGLSEHTSNWAVLVCTSRFWFNYRHLANVLSIYRTVKRLGIPDSQIILMLPDDMACNPRNAFPGTVYSNSDRAVDLYGDNIEVDYRGYEVTVENFIRLLTDRVGDEMPRSKRLLTDDRSNILVYMTGHGGNEFLKFQDAEEIGSFDLADAFQQMWEKKSRLYSPNIIATGSSELDQSSYSHHADNDIGVAVIDRYTYYNLEFLESQVKDLNSPRTVGELFDSYDYEKIHSNAGVRYDLFPGGAEAARSRLITDFFGNIQNVEVDRDSSSSLDEKLLALSKTISLLREKEAEEIAALRNASSAPASAPAEPVIKVQRATVLTDDKWWTKKVVGATALAGCGARPLEPLELKARPLAYHAIAWSCDAELAVATDDTIHIFLPEYPRAGRNPEDAGDDDSLQPQFSLTLTACGIVRPDPAINGPLCGFAGVSLPTSGPGEPLVFRGVGGSEATKAGSALGQTIRVEWSPSGLGQNLRPILTVMTTSGSLVALGEYIDQKTAISSSSRARTFKNWKLLWGLGANLPIPDGESKRGFRNMNERIVSFSWAKEITPGSGLLAYLNDVREVVIVAVQFFRRSSEPDESSPDVAGWGIFEIDRFDGRGPHDATETADPEFVPTGGPFSLRWSPWHITSEYRTATVAYLGKNHVGFRRVTIQGRWHRGQDPSVRVEELDTTSICTFLSADAFVEWEDTVLPRFEGLAGAEANARQVWQHNDERMARGIIATPFVVKPFQVDLCANPAACPAHHSPRDCSTLYPGPGETCTNPITGLVVHHPSPSAKPHEPLYTLVRLSATANNQDWYQTNLPPTTPLPQWAERIRRSVAREVSRVEALGGIDSESDTDSEFDEPEVHDMALASEEDVASKVHPHRFRLWGLASSPADGSMAALVSKHATQHAERRPRSRIMFSWDTGEHADPTARHVPKLTTEGTIWESMYGRILDMPSFLLGTTDRSLVHETSLRRAFKGVIPRQECVFCGTGLVTLGDESVCERGHSFATCTATGLAIMAPAVSRVCSVCGLRCLKLSELVRTARRHLGADAAVESAGELCGGCGGKFLL